MVLQRQLGSRAFVPMPDEGLKQENLTTIVAVKAD
jgi:hypothetical protein